MEYDKIKQLMEDMGNSKLFAMDIEFPDGTKVSMKKGPTDVAVSSNNSNINQETKVVSTAKTVELSEEVIEKKEVIDENANIIKSPMVGTFYLKPSPTSNPYVELGKTVKKGDIICIVEAMKLMNEIESEFDGEIVEIYVKDGEAVEYGKPLFRVK